MPTALLHPVPRTAAIRTSLSALLLTHMAHICVPLRAAYSDSSPQHLITAFARLDIYVSLALSLTFTCSPDSLPVQMNKSSLTRVTLVFTIKSYFYVDDIRLHSLRSRLTLHLAYASCLPEGQSNPSGLQHTTIFGAVDGRITLRVLIPSRLHDSSLHSPFVSAPASVHLKTVIQPWPTEGSSSSDQLSDNNPVTLTMHPCSTDS